MARSAHDIVDRLIGARTQVLIDRLTEQVGPKAEVIALGDPNRVGLTVVNIGSENLVIGLDQRVASGRGITIVPAGSFSALVEFDYILPAQEWWGWSSVNTGIYVLEVLLAPSDVVEPVNPAFLPG